MTSERPQLRTLEEAVAGPGEIADPYLEHLAAARKIAEEYFDAELVLPDLPDYHATSKLARGTLGFAAPRWIDRLLSYRKRGEGTTRFVDSGTQRANTSFNTRGEPIVNTADDAVRSAEALGVDVLVVGDALFDRR